MDSPTALSRICFIINPISGTQSKNAVEQAIVRNIDTTRYHYTLTYTQYAGHAALLAEQAAQEGVDVVVAVGGDGTINEVARSLVHTSTALGIVPCGSGNGLARHLCIPLDPYAAVDIINQGVVHCVDYGKINGQAFFCTCGVGFDAFISMKFAEAGKRGLTTYIEKTLTDGISYKPETYTLTFEEEGETVQYDAFLIACANASQYGNNAYIAPHASMKDGLLDVVILQPFNVLESPAVAMQLFSKTLPQNSHVKMLRTSRLRIERAQAGPAHCDGDPFEMGKTIDVEIVPNALHVVVNTEAKREPKPNLLQQMTAPFNIQQNLEAIRRTHEELRRKTNEELHRLNTTILEKLRKL